MTRRLHTTIEQTITYIPTGQMEDSPYDPHEAHRAVFARMHGPTREPTTIDYQSPQEVPVPLRHAIAASSRNGFTDQDLSMIYALPLEWVRVFTAGASDDFAQFQDNFPMDRQGRLAKNIFEK